MLVPRDIVSWEAFVQRVRRHRPSELLPAIALANIAIAPDGQWGQERSRLLYPWSLAVAAKESLRAGNELRPTGVTGHDLVDISRMHHNLWDPIVEDHDALGLLIRFAYEQFPFQEPLFYGFARSRLLFQQPSPEAGAQLRIVRASFWEDTLGSTLETLFSAGFLFGVGALQNGGYFNLEWFRQPNFAPVAALLIGEAEARHAMLHLFSTTRDEFIELCPPRPSRGYERVAFNPLLARPFVRTADGRFLAPVPQFVYWRASAPALYYMALERLAEEQKSTFTDDVGTLFEDYILRQARQAPLEAVYGEIEHRAGATTDVTMVFADFVLLVEAKATRLRESSRMGGNTLRDDIDRTLGRAFAQIEKTAFLIHAGDPAVADIPGDRPLFGLVVTLEPYYVSGFARDVVGYEKPSLPLAVASIGDFERFVADCIGEPLKSSEMNGLITSNQAAWDVDELIRRRNAMQYRNPMLDEEFARLTQLIPEPLADPEAPDVA